MRLALHISGYSESSSATSLSYGIALHHRLRLTFLRANLEACAERMLQALPSSVVLPLDAPVEVLSYPFPIMACSSLLFPLHRDLCRQGPAGLAVKAAGLARGERGFDSLRSHAR